MKRYVVLHAISIAALGVLLAGACSDRSDATTPVLEPFDDPAGIDATPANGDDELAVLPESTQPAPTATPAPYEPTDDERIEAARTALTEHGLDGYIAWDELDVEVSQNGLVTFTLCAWAGDTVHDHVRDSRWTTTATKDTVVAESAGHSLTAGDCLNTELVDSALAFIRDYENWFRDVTLEELRTLGTNNGYQTPELAASTLENREQREADGIEIVRAALYGQIPSSTLRSLLYTRQDEEIHFVACEAMNPKHGWYRGQVLLDDFKPDDFVGDHAITAYRLTRNGSVAWRVSGRQVLAWSDCFEVDDFAAGVAHWRGFGIWSELSQ